VEIIALSCAKNTLLFQLKKFSLFFALKNVVLFETKKSFEETDLILSAKN